MASPTRLSRLVRAALAAGLAASCAPAPAPARGPSVVLITIDTLRADHLGCYGYARSSSPNLDRLAAEGVRFENARAQAPWTLPSMASLFTGLYPFEHGVLNTESRLSDEAPTLPGVFAAAGYHTAGAVAHRLVTAKYGFARGFAEFDDTSVVTAHESSSEAVTQRTLQLFERAPGDRPTFLWVHYFDPHLDYLEHVDDAFTDDYQGPLDDDVAWSELRDEPERWSRADVEHMETLYDSEIAHTDHWVGVLLAGLAERGLDSDALIAVTSDHGESFRDHGQFGHGRWVYDEFLRVPLLLAGGLPDSVAPGTVLEHDVELRRLAATLAELCGVESTGLRGPSLLDPDAVDLPSLAQGHHAWGPAEHSVAIVRRGWKLILPHGDVAGELYDLQHDPEERRNLWDDAKARSTRESLARDLHLLERAPTLEADSVELDAADLEHLRSLGYAE